MFIGRTDVEAETLILWPPDVKSWTSSRDATKMGSIKDRNGMDLTETEGIKKRWQEYKEELYKKDLHDQENHDGVITLLEPDILECEVKWALGSITTSRASGLKKISPGCSLEGLMLKLKLQYFGHLMRRTDSLEQTLMLGKIEGGRKRGQQRMR